MDKTDKEPWHLDKRVPIAIIVTLVLQSATFLTVGSWWASRIDSRVEQVETKQKDYDAAKILAQGESSKVGERLASLETQSKNQTDSLHRIEDILIRKTK